jgi:peptidoglycan/xylan/chitin deacetylase (PgdA/CDA1 family)
MSASALIVTYHAVQCGPKPLCIPPALFAEHLDCLLDCGARTMTISELTSALRNGELPERAVAITFDDGFRSVATQAAPMLVERGMSATVFCVAGHLGGDNDWPSQPPRAPRLALAGAAELSALARAGFEVGSHGMEHAPLARANRELAKVEIGHSKAVLEQSVGTPVRSFAYPYGALPSTVARAAVEATYDGAVGAGLASLRATDDLYALPRVDAHYLRRPERLRAAALGSLEVYLRGRRLAARARRLLVSDWA